MYLGIKVNIEIKFLTIAFTLSCSSDDGGNDTPPPGTSSDGGIGSSSSDGGGGNGLVNGANEVRKIFKENGKV